MHWPLISQGNNKNNNQSTNMKSFISFCLLLIFASSFGQQCNDSLLHTYIKSLFKNSIYTTNQGKKITSCDYQSIKQYNAPILKKLLPNYCFYYIQFGTRFYEVAYFQATIVIHHKESLKSFSSLDPSESDLHNIYSKLFQGIQAKDSTEASQLAIEISKIIVMGNLEVRQEMDITRKEVIPIGIHDGSGMGSFGYHDFHFKKYKLVKLKILSWDEVHKNYRRYRPIGWIPENP
jgi:hypothetical protein